jgi:hypothetical protein
MYTTFPNRLGPFELIIRTVLLLLRKRIKVVQAKIKLDSKEGYAKDNFCEDSGRVALCCFKETATFDKVHIYSFQLYYDYTIVAQLTTLICILGILGKHKHHASS